MTLVLHRAERADVLADVLADLLAEPVADPFAPEVVAVHSQGVERWLSHRLAARLGSSPGRADGVCANLRFPFPGRLVQAALATATGVDAAADPWQPERLAWPLLEVVEGCLGEPWLAVLAGHLGAGEPGHPDGDRRFAAVRHLADLYDRYAVHRPAMVLHWAVGEDLDGQGAALPADARWQAELWRRLRRAVGAPSPAERAAEGCAALAADPSLADLPERLSLFGLTRLPASYLDVLAALAHHRDVHVMALHPSPAGWGVEGPAGLAHPLLRAWGRDSHEMQVVLHRRLHPPAAGPVEAPAGVDRHHPLPGPAGTGLLHRLQAMVRADEAPTGAADRPLLDPADRSVQVHACHGRARQVEVARDAITHLLADDPTLEPRDVVVLCPDIDELAPLLRAAFDDEPDAPARIPHRLADRALRQTNPVLGAVAELLALVDARLTASQVLAFAALGPVRQRFRFDDDDLERLAGWVEATGTRWGLDPAHRAPFDLAAVDAGTWAAGLRRLLLGVAMSEDDQRLVGGALPLDDVDSGDIDLAGRVAELVGRLGDAVRDLAAPRPLSGWAAALDAAADRLLATRPAEAWQRAQLDQLLTEAQDEAAGSAAPLRLAELRDLLGDRLRGRPSRAAFRTGELTLCTLVPMRSVPHRVVCVVGLDDGAFPRGGAVDGDDLLARTRQLGDHDRRSEDRQLLLDALLAATDAFVVTYSGHDPRTNEALPPAVPVNELLDVIDATVRRGDGSPARRSVVQHHPLQPSDPRCFEPGALGVAGPWGFDPRQLAGARAALGAPSPPPAFLEHPLPPVEEPVVALDLLVAAVQQPVAAFVRQRLGLVLRVDDDRAADALPVELDGLAHWAVGDRLLAQLLAGGDPDEVCAAELGRGTLPPGGLGRRALERARATAVAVAAEARRAADGPSRSLEVDVALGDGRQLVGAVPDVVGDVLRAATFSRLGPRQQLRAWAHLLAASVAHPDRRLRSVTVGRGPGGATAFRLGPLDAATARLHLEDLVRLRDEALCEPLPLYCATSAAFAAAHASRRGDPRELASREWTTDFRYPKEDRDPAHLLVLGGQRGVDEVLADARFAVLATRLWGPLLAAAGGTR